MLSASMKTVVARNGVTNEVLNYKKVWKKTKYYTDFGSVGKVNDGDDDITIAAENYVFVIVNGPSIIEINLASIHKSLYLYLNGSRRIGFISPLRHNIDIALSM